MSVIEYKIEIPEKALHLLANIHTPTEQESAVMSIVSYYSEKENNPFYWSFSKFWHKYVKLIPDELTREDLVKEYFFMRQKIAKNKREGQVYKKNPLFFHKATPIKELATISGNSVENTTACIRDSLFGLVGIVTESFHHSITTGDKEKDTELFAYFPDGKPVRGKPIRVIRYKGVYIPFPIGDKVQQCIDKEPNELGFFEILMQINTSSLPILKYISERTDKLTKEKTRRTYIQFHTTELSRVTGIGKSKVRKAVIDLLGVLAETIYPMNQKRYKHTVFLPPCRKELAEDLLREVWI